MPEKLREQIQWSVNELRERAIKEYAVDINPEIRFGVTGLTAAYALFDDNTLDFNLDLGTQNRELFATEIAGHEFIHLLANELHGHQHHGRAWKDLMHEFGISPTLRYKLQGAVGRQEKTYLYKCLCKTRRVSREAHLNNRRRIMTCPDCSGIANCINDRESELGRLRPGTREWEISQLLSAYEELEVPTAHAILLIKDVLGVTYSTAKTYYYKFRPAKKAP